MSPCLQDQLPFKLSRTTKASWGKRRFYVLLFKYELFVVIYSFLHWNLTLYVDGTFLFGNIEYIIDGLLYDECIDTTLNRISTVCFYNEYIYDYFFIFYKKYDEWESFSTYEWLEYFICQVSFIKKIKHIRQVNTINLWFMMIVTLNLFSVTSIWHLSIA